MPACRRRATTNASCCGCRTATPCRSRPARSRWTAWARSTRWRWTAPSVPFATVALDVADLLPDVRWPAQIELRAGRHVVRPRYEVTRAARVRIAHVNVERADLRPEPAIASLPPELGRGFLLPFPVLPRDRFRSIVQPTPMAESQANLPLRLDVFDTAGRKVAQRFLGCLPRDHAVAVDFDDIAIDSGHAELVYDFRDGGAADGWLHALFRYEDRQSGHVAESSFGAHMFNTVMTWRDEPQSYSGAAAGPFDDAVPAARRCAAAQLRGADLSRLGTVARGVRHGAETARRRGTRRSPSKRLTIACSGSAMVWPVEIFGAAALREAGPDGYVLVRDATCRLFGYHGLMDDAGGFSLDHMFGF